MMKLINRHCYFCRQPLDFNEAQKMLNTNTYEEFYICKACDIGLKGLGNE